jgi:site-specific recombinase XerD
MSDSLITVKTSPIERPSFIQQWHSALELAIAAGQTSKDTAATYKAAMRRFEVWTRGRYEIGVELDNDAIKQWLAALQEEGQSVKTISVWLFGVRAFFRWMLEQKLIVADPTAGIHAGTLINGNCRRHKRDALTPEEVGRLLTLDSLSKRDRALIYLMLYTGAKGIEMHRTKIEDIRMEGDELIIFIRGRGKGPHDERTRLIITRKPVSDAVIDYLSELAEVGHESGALFATEHKFNGQRRGLSRCRLRGLVKEAMKRAGIDGDYTKTVSSLRLTAARTALNNGEETRIEEAAERFISY